MPSKKTRRGSKSRKRHTRRNKRKGGRAPVSNMNLSLQPVVHTYNSNGNSNGSTINNSNNTILNKLHSQIKNYSESIQNNSERTDARNYFSQLINTILETPLEDILYINFDLSSGGKLTDIANAIIDAIVAGESISDIQTILQEFDFLN